jgi:hypothetical protein
VSEAILSERRTPEDSCFEDSPLHRTIECLGVVISRSVLGGLHHQYFQYLIFGTRKHDASVVHVIRNPCYNVIVESRECNCMTLRVYHDLY